MAPRPLLLVDDSPDVAVLVGALARRGGLAVHAVGSVGEALAALRATPVALILLDLNLGGTSGLELLRELGKGEPSARPLVALFCQPELTDDIAAGWALGADFLVSKALLASPDRWQERIGELLARGRGPGPGPGVQYQGGPEHLPAMFDSAAWRAAFLRGAQQPSLRALGPALFDEVLRRALARIAAGKPLSLAGRITTDRLEAVLATEVTTAEQARRFVGAVVDQVWCLYGAEQSAEAAGALGEEAMVGRPEAHLLRRERPRPVAGTGLGTKRARDLIPMATTLLLVEDNPADIKITQRALKEIGLPVDLVALRDGEEAIDYLQRRPGANVPWRRPDLLLLDLNLPRMTGRELLEKVRASADWRALPVIVLSTSRRAEDVAQMYALGANTYVEKPAEFDRFVGVLRSILEYWLQTALLPPLPGP